MNFIIFGDNITYLEKSLLADGLHPNTQGHELIYLTVKHYLQGACPEPAEGVKLGRKTK